MARRRMHTLSYFAKRQGYDLAALRSAAMSMGTMGADVALGNKTISAQQFGALKNYERGSRNIAKMQRAVEELATERNNFKVLGQQEGMEEISREQLLRTLDQQFSRNRRQIGKENSDFVKNFQNEISKMVIDTNTLRDLNMGVLTIEDLAVDIIMGRASEKARKRREVTLEDFNYDSHGNRYPNPPIDLSDIPF